jgi:hypothetical protein
MPEAGANLVRKAAGVGAGTRYSGYALLTCPCASVIRPTDRLTGTSLYSPNLGECAPTGSSKEKRPL